MLAFMIGVAVWAQFGSLELEIASPVGQIGFAVSEFGILLDYIDIGREWESRYAIRSTDTFAGNLFFTFNRRWDGSYFDVVGTRIVSLPGIVVCQGTVFDYNTPFQAIFAAVRYVWIVVPTLLLNVAAHWRVRRKTCRAKSPKPLTNP